MDPATRLDRGLGVGDAVDTPDFGLSVQHPLNTAIAVESIVWVG
jgi:hypothetical protein